MKKLFGKLVIAAFAVFVSVTNINSYTLHADDLPCDEASFEEIFDEAASADEMLALATDGELISDEAESSDSRFALKRLILMADDLDESYGAESIVYYEKYNEYILVFDSVADTESAYLEITKDYGKDKCFPDEKIETDDFLMDVPGIAPANTMSWGTSYMGMDYLKAEYDYYNIDEKVTVAVIDSGIDDSHALFYGRINKKSYNFYSGDYNVSDNVGHGTHVAGIIAEATPENVDLLILRCFDAEGTNTTSTLAIIAALEYAIENGADVVNMSLGWTGEQAEAFTYLEEGIVRAAGENVVICCAAGNKKQNVAYSYPANNPSVITVSAITKNGKFDSSYSNFGNTIDFAAPGTAVKSTYLNGTKVLSGTSMATPHIAAAAAYIKMAEGDISISDVEHRLREYSVDLGDLGRDDYYGNGYVNLHTYFDDMKLPRRGETEGGEGDTRPWQEKVMPILNFKSSKVNKTYGCAKFVNDLCVNSDSLVEYSSSNTNIAKVDAEGNVKVVGTGTCKITVEVKETEKFKGRTASYTLNVEKADITRMKIKLSQTSYVYAGKPCKPDVTVSGLKSSDYDVKYTGADRIGVARVTISGKDKCTGKVVLKYRIKFAKANIKAISNSTDGITLKWNKVKGASGYRVYRKTKGSSYKCIAKVSGVNRLSYTDVRVKNGKTYKYVVKPYKNKTQGASGKSKSLIRVNSTNAVASNTAYGIDIKWSSVKYATSYKIYRKTGKKKYICIAKVNTPVTTYTDSRAVMGTLNTYIVVPYRGNTRGGKSNPTNQVRRR